MGQEQGQLSFTTEAIFFWMFHPVFCKLWGFLVWLVGIDYPWLCGSVKFYSFLSFKIRKGGSFPTLGLFCTPAFWWILIWIFKGNLLQISGVFSPWNCLLAVCPRNSSYLLLNSQPFSSTWWVCSSQSPSFLFLALETLSRRWTQMVEGLTSFASHL